MERYGMQRGLSVSLKYGWNYAHELWDEWTVQRM
jgi:hypothetical protein